MALAALGIRVDILTRRIDDPQWQGFSEQTGWYTDNESGPRIVRIDCGGPGFLSKELLWPHLDEWVDNIMAFYGVTCRMPLPRTMPMPVTVPPC